MKTMLNIKTDSDLKKKAQTVARDLGLPLSVIMNNYLRELVQTERVVFETVLSPNKNTAKILKKSIEELEKGETNNFSPSFDNTEDATAWLNK